MHQPLVLLMRPLGVGNTKDFVSTKQRFTSFFIQVRSTSTTYPPIHHSLISLKHAEHLLILFSDHFQKAGGGNRTRVISLEG